MDNPLDTPNAGRKTAANHPFRRAVLRGLGVVMPPLLTIVVFLWAWNLIAAYVLEPIEGAAQHVIVWAIWDARATEPSADQIQLYRQVPNGQWIPREVYQTVNADPGRQDLRTPQSYFDRYVRICYLQRTTVIPLFLAVFILALYLLGKFLAAGMGRWIWASTEALIFRLPIIRHVYSAVKQVTDFIFSEQEIEFNRVVALEYPRKGIWSIGFVTGESMLGIRAAANEPVLSVLMPTSPMPATGFTITVRKSETVDLDLTVDQAIQFIVSCGVVVPFHQQYRVDGAGRVSALPVVKEVPRLEQDTSESDSASSNGDPRRESGDHAERSEARRKERA
jgi:uncharacterized membrane protein